MKIKTRRRVRFQLNLDATEAQIIAAVLGAVGASHQLSGRLYLDLAQALDAAGVDPDRFDTGIRSGALHLTE